MKVKHIIFWHFLIAALLLLLAFNGFGLGKCAMNAIRQGQRWQKSYPIRYGHGTYKDKGHMWCEYYRNGEWVMAKDTIRYVSGGWPVEAYGGYKVKYYTYPERVTKE